MTQIHSPHASTTLPAFLAVPSRPRNVRGDIEWMLGYGVWSMQFESGDLFALRCFPSAGLGGFTSLWHQAPDLSWRMYVASDTPDAACPRYFGSAVISAEPAEIETAWETERDLRIRVHRRHMLDLDWHVRLRSSWRTRILNTISRTLPEGAWHWPVLPRVMGSAVTRFLDLGDMRLTGQTPNGQRFWLNPRKVFLVDQSSARLDGRDLGPMAVPQRVVWLADYALPKRPLFAVGDAYAEAVDVPIPSALPTAALANDRLLLSKYVCHRVIDRVMDANQHGTFGGEEVFATVVFADLSGFTGLAERFQPEQVMSILNRNLQAIVETIFRYDGAVLKFLGDGVLASFGVHIQRDDDPARAAMAALEMMDTFEALQKQVPEQERVGLAVGIHCGSVISGNVGHENRLDFTIIGDAVNVASRLQTLAEPGEILVSDVLYDRLGGEFAAQDRGLVQVKGRAQAVRVHRLLGTNGP
jgi:class 3 adenylate cyclase